MKRSALRLILPAAAAAATTAGPVCTFDGGCSWDALDFSCTHPALAVDYTNVRHYSGAVTCGNLFLEQDIGGGAVNVAPLVLLPAADPDSFYTILMVDPDADVNGSFPEIDAPGPHAPVRHWIQGNVKGSDLAQGSLGDSDIVSAFIGPSPPAGSHRYGQFVFRQPAGEQTFAPFDPKTSPVNFDYAAWLKANNLTELAGSNWHVTQHTAPSATLAE